MGLFTKRISDQDWLARITPSYNAAIAVTSALDKAIDDDSIENQIASVQELLHRLPIIRETLKSLPSPTSPEARSTRKELEFALQDYVEGAKAGVKFFRDWAGGPGERLHWGGLSSRAAASRLAFSESIYKEMVKSARKHMARANAFFSGL